MGCSDSVLVLIFSFSVNLCFAFALVPYFQSSCVKNGNFTGGAAYWANLDRLSAGISSSNGKNVGFFNLTVGESPDAVNAIGACRGDANEKICKKCIYDTLPILRLNCPNNTEAVGWSEYCMLRYSNRKIVGIKETSPSGWRRNNSNVTDFNQFNPVLISLMNNLSRAAAVGGALQKYAAENATDPDLIDKIYAFVMCTPDLSEQDCGECLATATGKISQFCFGKIGCRILQPSCSLRYEIGAFLESTANRRRSLLDKAPTSSPPAPVEGKKKDNKVVIAIFSSLLSVLSLVLCVCCYLRIKRAREKNALDEILRAESLQNDFAAIQAATNNFSDKNKLGEGGFGPVYKGQLPSGHDVAVKRLSSSSGQGDSEFKNEVLLVAKLQHRNLVRLIGFCLKGKERLLIYEFVPNASLDHFIFDPIKSAQLDWGTRYRIIGGIARGLLYLHEDSQLRVIHRDLKPGNILLDAEMNPKIADFGMAKLCAVADTHETTRKVMGTYGYMAPEYIRQGQFSIKTDIYSFGVIILEIVSGQKNNSRRQGEQYALNLVNLAWEHWREGTPLNIVDPNLRGEASTAEMMKCIHVGLLCVQENALMRPTMGSIVLMLSSDSASMPTPSESSFSMSSAAQSEMSSSLEWRPASTSTNQVSITQLYPR